MHVMNFKSRVQFVDRYAPVEVANVPLILHGLHVKLYA
jgi:hypothetical protein